MKKVIALLMVGALGSGCTVIGAVAGDRMAEANNLEATQAEQQHRKGPDRMSVDGTSLTLAAVGFALDFLMVYAVASQIQDGLATNY